ncbi:MAG: hypothetical protein VR69_06025 [Peptococcaceae bacterium BRH_c4b]|nr:MAG: hypothetical protein VR69_06025 [Peptococcaceae bacterium BRH_c4b]
MCGNGCNCTPNGTHLKVLDGGKSLNISPDNAKMDSSNLYSHLVAKSMQIYQSFEEEELSQERALGYLTAMEDIIKAAWGENNSLCHSIKKLIKDVENN